MHEQALQRVSRGPVAGMLPPSPQGWIYGAPARQSPGSHALQDLCMSTTKEKPATLLGFDYGTRKIGVAVGQSLTGTATPLTTLRLVQNHPDWESIRHLIEEWQPEALVVGLPFQMDDTPAEMNRKALRFARQLASPRGKPGAASVAAP